MSDSRLRIFCCPAHDLHAIGALAVKHHLVFVD
jgi:hypothetical protein